MWWALRTKSRNEKKAAQRLEAEGIEVYCPLYLSKRRWSDRTKKVMMPLFNGYLFVRQDPYLLEKIYFIPGVSGFVYYNGEKANVRDTEIERIKKFTGELSSLSDQDIEIEIGDRVEIHQGQFEGHEGIVYGRSNKRYTLEIEGLGWQVRVKLPRHHLKSA